MMHRQPREGSVGCPHAFARAVRLAPSLAAAVLAAAWIAPLLLAGAVRADGLLFTEQRFATGAAPERVVIGDIDRDGDVDQADLQALLSRMGQRVHEGATSGAADAARRAADINHDNVVNATDLLALLANLGNILAGVDATLQSSECPPGSENPVFPCSGSSSGSGSDCTACIAGGGSPGGDNPPPSGGGGPGPQPPPTPPPTPDPTPQCSVTIAPGPNDNALPKLVGVWTPNDTDSDDTNDTADLTTITANGSDAQGTYSWAVTRGAGLVQFVNPDTGKTDAAPTTNSVRLQGLAKSAMLNDVTIEVTHTTQDGCEATDMLKLTIIAVTMTFRPANPLAVPRETWSPNNDVDKTLFVGTGAPNLGFIAPGDPAQAIGFFKNMEIKATIAPCVAGLDAAFDLKRQRQGLDGAVYTDVKGALIQRPGSFNCPIPMWCDDDVLGDVNGDGKPDDEDLLLTPPTDCDLFVIDDPGWNPQGQTCQTLAQEAAAAGIAKTGNPYSFFAVINGFDFRESLNADKRRISNTLPWQAKTEVDCMNNMLIQSNKFTNNRFGNALGQQQPAAGNGITPVTSPGHFDDVDFIIVKTEEIFANQYTFDELISIASDRAQIPPNKEKVFAWWQPPRLSAILALGYYNSTASIRTLVNLLYVTRFGPRNNISFPYPYYRPAAKALVQIGDAAIPALLERVDTQDKDMWDGVYETVKGLDRKSPAVRKEMRVMLNAYTSAPPATDPVENDRRIRVKQRLKDFLSTGEPQRPKHVAPPPNPGDLDGDRVIGPADLRLMLLDMGDCANCPADTNHDGRVDARNVVELMSHWGAADEK